jgi:uncharacterized protein YacL
LEEKMIHAVKQKITGIQRKQRIASIIISVGIIIFILGCVLAPFNLMSIVIAFFGSFVSIIGGIIWIYFATQKSGTILEFKTYFCIKHLQNRLEDHEDGALIRELVSD